MIIMNSRWLDRKISLETERTLVYCMGGCTVRKEQELIKQQLQGRYEYYCMSFEQYRRKFQIVTNMFSVTDDSFMFQLRVGILCSGVLWNEDLL